MITLETKVSILADYTAYNDGNEEAMDTDFWHDWSSTTTTCLYSSVGWVTINESMYPYIDQAWDAFCEFLEIDRHGDYADLAEVMAVYRDE